MKKIASILLVFLGPVIFLTETYLSAEEQYQKFEGVSRGLDKSQVLEDFGEPLEYIRRFEYVYWGELATSKENDGSCLDGLSFESTDVVFHPQMYLFCFDSKNKVVSKLVLRVDGRANVYRNIIKTIGFKPS